MGCLFDSLQFSILKKPIEGQDSKMIGPSGQIRSCDWLTAALSDVRFDSNAAREVTQLAQERHKLFCYSKDFESILLIFKFFSVTRECLGKLAELTLNDAVLIFYRTCPYLQIARCCLPLYSCSLLHGTQIRPNR